MSSTRLTFVSGQAALGRKAGQSSEKAGLKGLVGYKSHRMARSNIFFCFDSMTTSAMSELIKSYGFSYCEAMECARET